MKGAVGFWIAMAILVILHFLLHLGLGIGREAPDLLTVALLLAARTGGLGRGAGLGFVFGLLEDAFSVLAFGANAVAMTLIGALGASTRDLFVGESILFFVAYLILGKWLRDLLQWLMVGEALREPFVQEMLVQSVVASFYAAVVGVAVVVVSGSLREVRA